MPTRLKADVMYRLLPKTLGTPPKAHADILRHGIAVMDGERVVSELFESRPTESILTSMYDDECRLDTIGRN